MRDLTPTSIRTPTSESLRDVAGATGLLLPWLEWSISHRAEHPATQHRIETDFLLLLWYHGGRIGQFLELMQALGAPEELIFERTEDSYFRFDEAVRVLGAIAPRARPAPAATTLTIPQTCLAPLYTWLMQRYEPTHDFWKGLGSGLGTYLRVKPDQVSGVPDEATS